MIFAGLAAALGLASPASAGVSQVTPHSLGSSHGLKYVRGSFLTFGTGFFERALACPQTAADVGGGVDLSGPAAQNRVVGSQPFEDVFTPDSIVGDDGWLGAAEFGSSTGKVTLYAICRKAGPAKVRYAEGSSKTSGGETFSVKAKCPAGTKVSGGGQAETSMRVSVSTPYDGADAGHVPDDGWRIKGRGNGNMAFAEAVCLKHAAGPLSYRSTSGKTPAGGSRTLKASCPKASAVTGGGIAIGGNPVSRFIHSTRPRDSGADANTIPDDRWSATAVNNGGAAANTTVRAICLS